jgi:hypothetical protein
VFSGCTSFKVSVSWFYGSYTSADIFVLFSSGSGCWISSSMGVGFTGVVSGDGISSTLTIYGGYCLPSSIFPRDLVLTLVGLALWLAYVCLGGAMAWNIKRLLDSNDLCDLYELPLCFSTSMALCLLFFHE